MELQEIEKEINKIRERNARVEAEKAWEVSGARKVTITLATYIVAGLVLAAMGNDHPWRNALIPSLGYFLSTQSLPFIKRRWIARHIKSNGPK